MEGCGAVFDRKNNLTKHIKGHSKLKSVKEYICASCQISFSKWSELLSHNQQLHPKVFKCEVCGKEFNKARNLLGHGKVHDPNHVFPCTAEGCDKVLSSKSSLSVHLKTVHMKIKPYACDECGKCFSHKHLVARHKRVHVAKELDELRKDNEKEEEMEIESRINFLSQNSNNFIKALSGIDYELERELACPHPTCQHRFSNAYHLNRHLEAVHEQGGIEEING